MQTNEFYRIPVNAIVNIATGNATSFQVNAAKRLGRTMNPVVVTLKGLNKETFEMEFSVATNGAMAEVAKLAGLEFVDAFLVNEEDVDAVKELF